MQFFPKTEKRAEKPEKRGGNFVKNAKFSFHYINIYKSAEKTKKAKNFQILFYFHNFLKKMLIFC